VLALGDIGLNFLLNDIPGAGASGHQVQVGLVSAQVASHQHAEKHIGSFGSHTSVDTQALSIEQRQVGA